MNVQGYRLPIEVIHPLTHEKIPVYVANYVVADYGEGAVMGVPAHDDRDKSFAQLFKLPCKQVVKDQKLMNSQQFDGLTVKEATAKILTEAQQQQWGKAITKYRLRDWLVSRQRYWGAPVPAIHCEHCGVVPVPYEDLPVKLPVMNNETVSKMTGEEAISPLGSRINE